MFILIVKLKNQLQVKWRLKSKSAKVHLKARNISHFVRFSKTSSLALCELVTKAENNCSYKCEALNA